MIDTKPEFLRTDLLIIGGGAAGCMAAVEARAVTEDAGTVGERRSMALADLALGRSADVASSAAGAMALDVVVDLRTLMGLDDAPASLAGDGCGAVAVEAADVRALIASATSATLVVTGGKPRRFKAEVAA